jgi:hypothetical protein
VAVALAVLLALALALALAVLLVLAVRSVRVAVGVVGRRVALLAILAVVVLARWLRLLSRLRLRMAVAAV